MHTKDHENGGGRRKTGAFLKEEAQKIQSTPHWPCSFHWIPNDKDGLSICSNPWRAVKEFSSLLHRFYWSCRPGGDWEGFSAVRNKTVVRLKKDRDKETETGKELRGCMLTENKRKGLSRLMRWGWARGKMSLITLASPLSAPPHHTNAQYSIYIQKRPVKQPSLPHCALFTALRVWNRSQTAAHPNINLSWEFSVVEVQFMYVINDMLTVSGRIQCKDWCRQ